MKDDRDTVTRPCKGCGYCCHKAMCAPGVMLVGKMERHCPGLYWDSSENKYRCAYAKNNNTFAAAIWAGEGCCSPLNSWRKDVRKRSYEEIQEIGPPC